MLKVYKGTKDMNLHDSQYRRPFRYYVIFGLDKLSSDMDLKQDILMSQVVLLTPPILSVKLVFGRCLDDHRLRSFGCLVCPGY